MKRQFYIAIRFIQPYPLFHGRGDANGPEWPPSPMRVFQALLNAASLLARGRPLPDDTQKSLRELEVLRPEILAPKASLCATGFRAYVPHNQTDLVTAAWHRGNPEASVASHRMEKDSRPMRIEQINDEHPTLYYIYSSADGALSSDELIRALRPSIRAITHLGWGIDQVVADAGEVGGDGARSRLSGDRWLPSISLGRRLRVPRAGSLDALLVRYTQFLSRLRDGWTPVAPLTQVEYMAYRRDTEPPSRPHAVFKLLDDDLDTARYPHAMLAHIAAVARHAAIDSMGRGENAPSWMAEAERGPWVNRFVRGMNQPQLDSHQQISYVPLPSIGHEHADAMVRNVMLIAPVGRERELEHVAARLDGVSLEFKHAGEEFNSTRPLAGSLPRSLQRFNPPTGKFIQECYLGRSKVWQSVTPVILDEHIDNKTRETPEGQKTKERNPEDFRRLIALALRRAGIETRCEFTWQTLPFYKNCLSAHRYDRDKRPTFVLPKRLDGKTAVHLRLAFDGEVSGPITIGAGRHCGFGLFAAAN